MATEQFYLGNRLVLVRDNGMLEDLLNLAVFCSYCGEVWLRIIHANAEYWNVIRRPCENHGGGTILQYEYCNCTEGFDSELLKREFLLQTAIVPKLLEERQNGRSKG